ncbi:MAG TPA: outer membrane protein assembly factor BamD [Gemmatimonadaceae bacterium]|nr:outer membrane protein assembly factor BamD [Gemmatimonadaceae bacterium]
MTARRLRTRALLVCAVFAAAFASGACRRGFQVRDYPSPQELYIAGMEQFRQEKWKNAVTALDQVVVLLGPRDTLLPRAHLYLAQAHAHRDHFLLASKSYEDLYRGFADDTLADDALLGMADSEAKLWRRPDLDPEHGRKASEAYALLPRLYPASPLIERAQQGGRRLAEMFGRKDFDIGMGLLRRKADISALIYFKAVLADYPGTKSARDAGLKMAEIYRTLKYTEDLAETCTQLKLLYATDGAVRQICGSAAVDSTG